MTIEQAISNADKLNPNTYPMSMKIKWLSNLDGQVFKEVFQTHEGCNVESFAGYDDKTPMGTELLIPSPYDEEIYSYFLRKNIERENGETARYNKTVTLYNNAFLAFQNYYNRTHMPISKGKRFVF